MDVDISKIFPAAFSVPLSRGGKAIPRRTLNGILKLLGDWIYYIQNGGIASYSASFDYAVGRVVLYNGTLYKCIQANGASSTVVAPDSVSHVGSDYWVQFANPDFSNVTNTANILMAHNAMPSNRVVALTLPAPATNTQYQAPADGFVIMQVSINTPNNLMQLYTTTKQNGVTFGKVGFRLYASASNQKLLACIPVSKNDYFYVYYYDKTSSSTDNYLNFVYAQGSVSEAN